MKFLDLSFLTPEENLACDEALLDACDENESDEILRFWESRTPFVVAGYSNKIQTEVNIPFCEKKNIPILRRPSGGGTVLQGPGCLNYALILKIQKPYENIQSTNRAVMQTLCEALQKITAQPIEVRGITDLALGGFKFSGNAQRRKRNYLLFHGTFLYAADKGLIQQTLLFPSKTPCYRLNRAHTEFIKNLEATDNQIKNAVKKGWKANTPLKDIPHDRIKTLVESKYSRKEWNLKY